MGRVTPFTLHLTVTALLYLCTKLSCVEISPDEGELVLTEGSSFTFTCSGSGKTTWEFKREDVPYIQVEQTQSVGQSYTIDYSSATSSVLTLWNVSWKHTGVYQCVDQNTGETKEVSVFVPDPMVWFIESSHGMVTKTSEESTIPCVVTDPNINVTLYEKDTDVPIKGVYIPSEGYKARLEDRTYVCRGEMKGEVKESQSFYVFSIVVPEAIDTYVNASKTVLKQGEPLTVNCTVQGVELAFFSWDIPNREVIEVEPLTDVLSTMNMRSCLIFPQSTVAHSGNYICHVHEGVQDQKASASINITVLERGFVDLKPAQNQNISARLQENVELRVEIEAYPQPLVHWSKDGVTLTPDKTITTRQEHEIRYVTILTLVRVRIEQRGLYTVHVANGDDTKEVTFDLEVHVPSQIKELTDHHLPGKRHLVTCVAEGVPAPSIEWFSCDSMHKCNNRSAEWKLLKPEPELLSIQTNVSYSETRKTRRVRSQLTFHKPQQVTVRCETNNSVGLTDKRDVKLVSSTLFSQVAVLAAVLALVVIIIMSIIILIAVWRKKPRYEIRWKVIESVSQDGHEYIYVDPIHLPYDLAWEVSRDNLVLGRTLGSGAFGRVVEATAFGLTHSQSSTKVAVKMLKSTARRSETQALMSELKIMSHLGPHLNIVNLLGACTKHGPLFLVTEYCRYGDLVDYLHRNKHSLLQYYAEKSQDDGCLISGGSTPLSQRKGYVSFGSESDGGYMDMSKDEPSLYVPMQEQIDSIKYADIQPSPYESPYQQDLYQEQGGGRLDLVICDSAVLTYDDLLSFSYQVAKGMEFLASKNCVHRDLAARNVLICEGKLVKICDFGLARDIMHDTNYISKGSTFLPLKWMAPESIFHNLYTTFSDVWSYGILLWEIFTLGGTPYPDLPMNELFYNALKRGYRMAKPAHASDEVYEIMKKCWDEKFEKRPEFSFLVHSVGNMLSDGYKKRYSQVNENFLKSDHPAVARTKPRLTSPFPIASPVFSPQSPVTPDPYNQSPSPGELRRQDDTQEVIPSYNEYIIPIPDPKPEEVFTDVPSESPASSLVLEEETDSLSQDTAETLPEEDRLEETSERDALLGSSGTPEVEDSFL
ncbi:platelet-derived growth factor receptor beta [Xyrichtys novacula]|uniref:receptor protein-tyrosine kinase n=1 Tax=Xyrichtys novacula TaxID=13765 RepID=A0AAV1FC68_XYRNO|nr:platelet-derived growth factor receptor beta [Xyrichtys novacula]